jgi:two-component sensor histidine kinase
LPSYKRRALVLAAAELVVNSLLHAFHGRGRGLIDVSLSVHGTESATLLVADDGIGFTAIRPNLDCGVAAGLAGLLEADLAHERKSGRTIAEIAFPLTGA